MSKDGPQDNRKRSENQKPGVGKNGRPFKDGNTDESGNFIVGKGRTPESTRFCVDDGRERGKRQKGSKNLATIWKKGLNRKHTINGVTMTGAEWIIESLVRRAISRSDRAAEKALEAYERFVRDSDPRMGLTDHEILEAYFAQKLSQLDNTISTDDPPPEGSDDVGGADADQ